MKNNFLSPFDSVSFSEFEDLCASIFVVVYHVGDSCRVAFKSDSRSSCLDVMVDLHTIHPDRQYSLVEVSFKSHSICSFR